MDCLVQGNWLMGVGNNGLFGIRDLVDGSRYYSTGVQIVSSTLSDDSVLSESTGLFNPVLCVSQ